MPSEPVPEWRPRRPPLRRMDLARSETDLTEDLKKFEVPTLIMHGDDDQIVPIADSAQLSAKIVKNTIMLKSIRNSFLVPQRYSNFGTHDALGEQIQFPTEYLMGI